MFGLRNFAGSCWINSCLQSVFRIPEVQERYDSGTFDKENSIDESLCKIWRSKGKDGLEQFFHSVRNAVMPAGHGIGDTHELLQHLCDKLPFLDELCRFKMADAITCNHCKDRSIKEDSVTEFEITAQKNGMPILECIVNTSIPVDISDRKCEKCEGLGCQKQQLFGSFPKVLTIHKTSINGSVEYPCILVLNKRKYALIAISCFTGGHWFSYGRNMPTGSPWYTLDDTNVTEHGPKQFPLCSRMRLLIYYRLEN